MLLLTWLIRGFLFFTLFAFALNNQQAVIVHFFFGTQWTSPLVIVVLVAFALGCGVGVLATLPGWWRQRRQARHAEGSQAPASSASVVPEPLSSTAPRQSL